MGKKQANARNAASTASATEGTKKSSLTAKQLQALQLQPRRRSLQSNLVMAYALGLIAAGCIFVKWEIDRRIAKLEAAGGDGALRHTQQCGRYGTGAVPGCSPTGKQCGHIVVDNFASAAEVEALRGIADRGMALGGGAGGPTILDLQSGALSYQDKFIDVWTAFNATNTPAFTKREVAVYAEVVERIRVLAERTFGVGAKPATTGGLGKQHPQSAATTTTPPRRRLHLTAPTFFSRIAGDKAPKTSHDEYWHAHVDLEQYGSFVFTSLLYLADGGADFDGGDFEFLPAGTPQKLAAGAEGAMSGAGAGAAGAPVASVTPSRGKLVLFSSGSEHPHRVTRVTRGTRLALTIAFTCDGAAAIHDFLGRALEPDAAS